MLLDQYGNEIKEVKKQLPKKQERWKSAKTTDVTFSWTRELTHINNLLWNYLTVLRARARQQVRDNDYAKRFVDLVKINTVGPTGFILQAQARRNDGRLDTSDNNSIERAYKDWSKPKNCDFLEELSYSELQRMIIGTWAIDGEIFIRLIRRPSLEYGFAIQIIDPEMCDTALNKDLPGGRKIRLGLEMDAEGKKIAYHFLKRRDEQFFPYDQRFEHERIPANNIIHFFIPEFVGQLRGFPPMAAALYTMNQLDGFEEAALVNARAGASKMGFFTENEDEVNYSGEEKASDGSFITNASPGEFVKLPAGVKFDTWEPQYPNNEFDSFVVRALTRIAASLGMSYNSFSGDYSKVNFSSARVGKNDDRDMWRMLQNRLEEKVIDPIYNIWLEMALLKQKITSDGGTPLPFSRIDKFKEVRWQSRRWASADPNKEASANRSDVDSRIKSISQIIREQGGDPESTFAEIASERELLRSLNIAPDSDEVTQQSLIQGVQQEESEK